MRCTGEFLCRFHTDERNKWSMRANVEAKFVPHCPRRTPYCPISSAEPWNRSSHPSSRHSRVVVEEPTQPLSTANPPARAHHRRALNELVLETSVIPLPVVMLDVLRDRPTKMAFAEPDHRAETFLFDRAHKPLGVRISRSAPETASAPRESRPRPPAREGTISVTDQYAMGDQHPLVGGGERTGYLAHERFIGCGDRRPARAGRPGRSRIPCRTCPGPAMSRLPS